MMEYPNFKVCVRCMTFNQSKYIAEAMNGFCMQQTNFPFVCCIVDDASTDGEQEVIKTYLACHFNLQDTTVAFRKETDYAYITYAQHKGNKNCYFAVLLLKENLYSKKEGYKKGRYISEWRDACEYEALCEGDDYWIHPGKLQTQVDRMDNDPKVGMVGTGSVHLEQITGKYTHHTATFQEIDLRITLLSGGIGMATCTVMYRKCAENGYNQFIKGKSWPLGDLPLWLFILHDYKIAVIPEETATYRILPNSASHFSSYNKEIYFWHQVLDLQLFFADRFDIPVQAELQRSSNKRMFRIALKYAKLKEAFRLLKDIVYSR